MLFLAKFCNFENRCYNWGTLPSLVSSARLLPATRFTNLRHQGRKSMSELYQIPADIRNEFVVTEDGRVFAKSWTAVSRLAGVKASTIFDRLLPRIRTNSAENLPKSLKLLAGKDLRYSPEIDEITISCIINYYAWESQAANDTAKSVAIVFNACGIRGFFQKEYGWLDPKDSKLDRIESMLSQVLGEMAVFKGATNEFPGITNIVQNTVNNNFLVLPPDFKEPFSIRDWVKVTQNRILTRGQCCSIGRMVSGAMTTLKLESPISYGTAKVYKYSDMPALTTIYKSWELANKK